MKFVKSLIDYEEKLISVAFADVSVVLPHFNAIDTIRLSIKSVALQSWQVKELIIVDDFSSDYKSLLKIVEEFEKQLTIKVLRLDVNSGASEARNQGVKVAKGKYLAFLDSDDIWHPDKIKIQYSLMLEKGMNFSGHSYVHNLQVAEMVFTVPLIIKKILPSRFIFRNPFFTPTIMVLKKSFIGFDPRYRRVDDYKCWLMNVMNSDAFLICAPLAGGFKPALGASGLTSSIALMHQSYLLVLNDMYREKLIDARFYLKARVVEYVKYPLRFLKYKFRKLF